MGLFSKGWSENYNDDQGSGRDERYSFTRQ